MNYCKECKKEITTGSKSGLCRSCSHKGQNNAIIHGKYSKNKHYYCQRCGVAISSFEHKWCLSCSKIESGKSRRGKNNCSFRTGKYSCDKKCIDCGKHCSPKAIRCLKCKQKYFKGKNAPMFGVKPSKYKAKKYKGIKMRSSWEIAYAKYLDKQGTKWLYESKTFDLGNCTYTPDFYLPESDTYVEIKGRWYKDAKKKFKIFQKKYFSMNIILLTRKELRKLKVIKC
jgi:hypothetical protein